MGKSRKKNFVECMLSEMNYRIQKGGIIRDYGLPFLVQEWAEWLIKKGEAMETIEDYVGFMLHIEYEWYAKLSFTIDEKHDELFSKFEILGDEFIINVQNVYKEIQDDKPKDEIEIIYDEYGRKIERVWNNDYTYDDFSFDRYGRIHNIRCCFVSDGRSNRRVFVKQKHNIEFEDSFFKDVDILVEVAKKCNSADTVVPKIADAIIEIWVNIFKKVDEFAEEIRVMDGESPGRYDYFKSSINSYIAFVKDYVLHIIKEKEEIGHTVQDTCYCPQYNELPFEEEFREYLQRLLENTKQVDSFFSMVKLVNHNVLSKWDEGGLLQELVERQELTMSHVAWAEWLERKLLLKLIWSEHRVLEGDSGLIPEQSVDMDLNWDEDSLKEYKPLPYIVAFAVYKQFLHRILHRKLNQEVITF